MYQLSQFPSINYHIFLVNTILTITLEKYTALLKESEYRLIQRNLLINMNIFNYHSSLVNILTITFS